MDSVRTASEDSRAFRLRTPRVEQGHVKRLLHAVTTRLQPVEYLDLMSTLLNDTKAGADWPNFGYQDGHRRSDASMRRNYPSKQLFEFRPIIVPRLRDFRILFEHELVPHPRSQNESRVEFVRVIKSLVPRNKAWTPQQAIELFRLMGFGRGRLPTGGREAEEDCTYSNDYDDTGYALAYIMTACGVTSEENIVGCLGCLLEFKTIDETLRIAVWFRLFVANNTTMIGSVSDMGLRAG
jgi:hypothetical protein